MSCEDWLYSFNMAPIPVESQDRRNDITISALKPADKGQDPFGGRVAQADQHLYLLTSPCELNSSIYILQRTQTLKVAVNQYLKLNVLDKKFENET